MLNRFYKGAYIINFCRKGRSLAGLFLLCLSLFSCAGKPPLKDYVLANEAQKYAKKYNANKLANGYYYKGRQSLKRAKYFYDQRDHEKAQKFFILARRYFEKAEVKARLKMLDNGGEDFL